MTYENRYTVNYAYGALTQAADKAAVTLVSDDFISRLPTGLNTTTYVPVTLQDPTTATYEIVWANSHTAGSNTATVLRGRESTTAVTWPAGTLWTIAPTLRDGLLWTPTRTALPTDPHVGLRAYIVDEQTVVEWTLGTGWLGNSPVLYRATRLLVADAASVAFTGIPTSLKQLTVVWTARFAWADFVAEVLLRINNDSGPNYFSNFQHQVNNAIAGNARVGANASLSGVGSGNSAQWFIYGNGEITIQGWNQPGGRNGVEMLYRSHVYDTQPNSWYSQGGTLYYGTGPYTSLTIFGPGNIRAGSEFTVYGWG